MTQDRFKRGEIRRLLFVVFALNWIVLTPFIAGFVATFGSTGLVVVYITASVAIAGKLVQLGWNDWRRRAQWKNRCTHCDYDLKKNVSGVCPECGNCIEDESKD